MVEKTQRKWLALALLATVQFMVVLDIAIVNVALPSIQVDLGFTPENLQWVISAYALFFGGFLLLGGRAADLLGRRRLFIAGTHRLQRRLVALGVRLERRVVDHLPSGSGTRRGDHHPCGAVDPDDDVLRRT